MMTQENIPYTADEIKAMVKTIESLRKTQKKYQDALEKVKGLLKDQEMALHAREKLANVFPELKSDDEKIRKAQIKKAALEYADTELIGIIDFKKEAAFIEGAEWADSHANWISVEDELPKKGDAILAMQDIQGNHWFTACQFIKADVRRGIVDFFVKSDAHIGISVDGKVTLGHVSHWMPRPVPPEHIADVSKMISSSELPNNRKGGVQ